MGKWALFFTFIFAIGELLTLIIEGGGFAATTLTASVGTNDAVFNVVSTDGFLAASVAHPAYAAVVDDTGEEAFFYTSQTATTLLGVSRGQSDPQSGVASVANVHSIGTWVKTLNITALDSFMGYNITSSSATFGALDALTFFWKMFANLPKMLSGDYPWFEGQAAVFRFVLFAFSAGFVFAIGMGMLWLGVSIWK